MMFFTRVKRTWPWRLAWASPVIFLAYLFLAPDSWHAAPSTTPSTTPHGALLQSETGDSKYEKLFYRLGGNGPWIPKVDGVVLPHDGVLPEGCFIDQVHLISRHAERYPTINAGARHLSLLKRLEESSKSNRGPLSFLKTWSYFTNADNPEFENLTTTGPYAGTTQAFGTGQKFRKRYSHLVSEEEPLNFWTCSSPRDIETAKMFGDGFFGPSWDSDGSAQLHIIPETEEQGANTLTPGDTCLKYINDEDFGHDQGYSKLADWQAQFSKPIIERLLPHVPGFHFTPLDVYSMMEMCGFEILVRGSSPWCDIFTEKEWLDFEYGRDLLHFYRAGPGNKYAGTMGYLWLHATQELISNDSARGPYFSFVHDGDLIPLMATLEQFNEGQEEMKTSTDFWDLQQQHLPSNKMKTDRRWKTSDIVPMGGRVVFERINCRKASFARRLKDKETIFVRLLINDGHINLRNNLGKDPLKYDMRLEQFERMVNARGKKYGDFRTVCGLDNDMPSKITFLHQ